jgi:hypothetical protein
VTRGATARPSIATIMTTPSSSRSRLPAGAGPNGWIAFAGIVLFLTGSLSALYGLAAILNDEVLSVGGRGVVIWDFTTWGWVTLIIGVGMALTGVGLFTGNTAARWFAVLFTVLNALAQFGTVTAFPLWSLLIIALDVVILYQLVARWQLED